MDGAAIAVLERNRAAGARIGRILAAAADLSAVAVLGGPDHLSGQRPRLVACDVVDAEAVLAWLDRQQRAVPLLVWCAEVGPALALAERDPRVRNIVGWPSFASIPRPTELSMAARRLLTPDLPLPPCSQLVPWGAFHAVHKVATSSERDQLVSVVVDQLRGVGVGERSAARAGEVAHELLTNAMYGAPVDAAGRPRYAQQRTVELTLPPAEAAALEVVFDGQHLVLEVADRFGRLRDEQILSSVARALANAAAEGPDGPNLDPRNGGGGIGLGLVHASSVAVVVEVVAGRSTRVAWHHDVELHPREYRALPASIHLFRAGEVP